MENHEPLRIRRYDTTDIPNERVLIKIGELFSSAYPRFRPYDPEEIMLAAVKKFARSHPHVWEQTLRAGSVLYVAEIRNRIIGLLECMQYSRDQAIHAYISYLMVDAQVRGRGVGTMLHEVFQNNFVRNLCRESNAEIIQCLDVDTLNDGARALYERWGYTRSLKQDYCSRSVAMEKKVEGADMKQEAVA